MQVTHRTHLENVLRDATSSCRALLLNVFWMLAHEQKMKQEAWSVIIVVVISVNGVGGAGCNCTLA